MIKKSILFLILTICILNGVSGRSKVSRNDLKAILPPQPPKGRIVFGEDVPAGQYIPYQVSLQYPNKAGNLQHICGGSIISRNRILTAAHCCDGFEAQRMSVLAGVRNLHDKDGQRTYVKSCKIHEQYEELKQNDIAVLYVHPPLNYTTKVARINVADSKSIIGGNVPVTLTGWGLRLPVDLPFLPEEINYPSTLQFLNYTTISNDECREIGFSDIKNSDLCALRKRLTPQGACSGDSGGPLVMQTESGARQVGVVSRGFLVCGIFPDVYTRVSSFTPWIRKNVDENESFEE